MKKGYFLFILLILSLLPLAAQNSGELIIRYDSKPDSVIIYPGNLIFGTDNCTLPDGPAVITLPAQVIPESILVFSGTKQLTGYKTRLEQSTGRVQLVCGISGNEGKDLSLFYLFRGASWTPVYNMTIFSDTKVRLDFSAAISSGSLSVTDTEVKLLSGLVISSDLLGDFYGLAMTMTQNNLGYQNRSEELSPATAGVTAAGEHHLYDTGKLSLEPGERMVKGIAAKDLTARKLLVWDTRNGDRTETIYKVTNDTGVPLPPGMVRIYQDGIYSGSDQIEWTPSGGEGSLTTAGMTGIRVRKQVSQETTSSNGRKTYRFTVTLTAENLTSEAVELTILDPKEGSGGQFEYDRKPAEQPGNILRWEIPLKPGKKETVTYNYIVVNY